MHFALAALAETSDFHAAALDFFQKLGYQSPITFDFDALSFDQFEEAMGSAGAIDKTRALGDQWKGLSPLFQFTKDQLDGKSSLLTDVKHDLFDAFVFLALELKGEAYSRTQLAAIARELNKPFKSPVIVLFKYGQTITLASVARREHKTQANEHVLQKVSLLKDIRLEDRGSQIVCVNGRISTVQYCTVKGQDYAEEKRSPRGAVSCRSIGSVACRLPECRRDVW